MKTQTKVLTMIRAEVMNQTYEKIIDTGEQVGVEQWELDWIRPRIRKMLEERMIDSLTLYGYDGKTPIGGVRWSIDWGQHTTYCQLNDEMDISSWAPGETFASTHELLDMSVQYLEGLKATAKNPNVHFWYTYNQASLDRLGGEEAWEAHVGITRSHSERQDMIKQRAALQRMEVAKGKIRSTHLPDLPEAGASFL